MKIAKNTKDLMIVEDRPYFTGFGLIAFSLYWLWVAMRTFLDGSFSGILPLTAFIASLFGFSVFVRLKVIELDRTAATLCIKTKNMWGEKIDVHSLHDVVGAELEDRKTRTSSGGTGRQYRIRFCIQPQNADEYTQKVAIYPTQTWAGGGWAGGKKFQTIVDAVNSWLEHG